MAAPSSTRDDRSVADLVKQASEPTAESVRRAAETRSMTLAVAGTVLVVAVAGIVV